MDMIDGDTDEPLKRRIERHSFDRLIMLSDGVFAIAIGIAAVVNYNATTGILGAALGLIAWIGVNTGRYKAAA